ncbi:MAG: two-component system, OmpR family, sensor kinase [Micromonosporaceae bacterium]|nr:two-component system, OmpR family, sensor kinase [Micromonosporaceae bacterium]
MSDDLRPSSADREMLRRATIVVAVQTTVAVAATIVLVSVIAYSLTVQTENLAQERLVRQTALTADSVFEPPVGVVLLRSLKGGPTEVSAEAPDGLERLDPWSVPDGLSNLRREGRDFEVYVVDRPGGWRMVALVEVTRRTQQANRLIGSVVGAAILGIIAAALVGIVLGRRAVRPLGRALAMQRRFVADVSHELRTPLAVVHTRAQLLQRRLTRAANAEPPTVLGADGPIAGIRDHVDQLVADTRALGEVVEDMLLAADLLHTPGGGQSVDAGQLATELVASIAPHAAALTVDLIARVESDRPLIVTGIRVSLRRALAALIDNALNHEHPGGTVIVRAGRSGPDVTLAVVDDGEGLDTDQAERLMQRHVRGATAGGVGQRFGIGLALVREVLMAHGGTLRVAGSPGRGATFTMVIPSASGSLPADHEVRSHRSR